VQATLEVRRINLLSLLLVVVALALGMVLGAGGALLLEADRQVAVSNQSPSVGPSPLPAECKRFGGPGC
jgi:hypothetical protein